MLIERLNALAHTGTLSFMFALAVAMLRYAYLVLRAWIASQSTRCTRYQVGALLIEGRTANDVERLLRIHLLNLKEEAISRPHRTS